MKYIDLFSGSGGLSLGLKNAGWHGVLAIEKSPDAFNTLTFNLIEKEKHFDWPSWLPVAPHDITCTISKYRNYIENLAGKVALVAGGPPCQGFSTAGRRNENDIRNKLIYSYVEFIRLVKPNLIFFENVKGFTYAFNRESQNGIRYSNIVAEELQKIGYSINAQVINFYDFGVPQRRKRFILVGSLNSETNSFFELLMSRKNEFLNKKGLDSNNSVGEAISDLHKSNGIKVSENTNKFEEGIYSKPSSPYQQYMRRNLSRDSKYPDSHRFARHTKLIRDRFNYLINNEPHGKELKNVLSKKYGLKKRTLVVLNKNSFSPTLTTLPDDCIHYCEPRILTVREYARIQSFPDCYEFKGKYTTGAKLRKIEVPRYTQIGNAIPPLFVEQVGNVLKEMLSYG